MSWNYWDDYYERNSDYEPPKQKPLTPEQQAKVDLYSANCKLLKEKREKIVTRFCLTKGQRKRLTETSDHGRLDQLLAMSSEQIEAELLKKRRGQFDQMSFVVKRKVKANISQPTPIDL